MNANPYRPIDIKAEDVALLENIDAAPMCWHVDWSKGGIQARWWHPLSHAAAGLLLLLLIVAARLEWNRGGIHPLEIAEFAILVSIVGWGWWFLIHEQSGRRFVKLFPCLVGDAVVEMDRGLITIVGQELSISARKLLCARIKPHRRFNKIKLPRFDLSLPLDGLDERPLETSDRPILAAKSSPKEMLSYLPNTNQNASSIAVEGMLTGLHFGNLNCRQHWFIIGTLFAALASVVAAATIIMLIAVSSMTHSVTRDELLTAIGLVGGPLCAVLGLISFGHFNKRFRKLEECASLLTHNCISIANNRIAYSYSGRALDQFTWTDHGLIAVNHRGTVKFVVPIGWFTPEQQETIASWYPPSERIARTRRYLGPFV